MSNLIETKNIRNFSIIAHIDHGKSTLADRFIQICEGLTDREMSNQVLDSMDIERERGITIKAQSVTLNYKADDGQIYELNFIDTPGHVDFSYEVSRSLAACEGAVLVVDATQGVEAQTVANCYSAIDANLEIIPVLNKSDLPSSNPEKVIKEIEEIIGIEATDACLISAKTGLNVKDVLESIVKKVPPPKVSSRDEDSRALIIDSWFDNYLGVVSLIRVVDGEIKVKDKIKFLSNKETYLVEGLGVFTPKRVKKNSLTAGDVGYLIAGVKDIYGAPVGDTVTTAINKPITPLPGFKSVQPRVFAGIFPSSNEDYPDLREALSKLQLNDAALFFEPETSSALGFGFRCGFLGMLHMEIVQERLEREYNLDLVVTAPTVIYEILTKKGEVISIDNPSSLPDRSLVEEIREPIIKANILAPEEYIGAVIKLCIEKRGVQQDLQYVGAQAVLSFELPMNEVVIDFFDKLKSNTRGYASMEYEMIRFDVSDLVKLEVLINGESVDALASISHRAFAVNRGKVLIDKLKTIIPRQMFEVALQASIGGKIIARSNVKALRKNVTAKCYGGDITRKKKLLEKQKAGKKRMKSVGKIQLPQEAFFAILNLSD